MKVCISDLARRLIVLSLEEMNDTNATIQETINYACEEDPVPKAATIIAEMDLGYAIFHIVLIVMAALSVGIFIDEIYFLRLHMKSTYRRRLTVIQLGIPPVFTVSSVTGCFFPAGYIMIDFVTTVYYGVALHCLLILLVHYYGSLDTFLKCFQKRSVSMRTGPCCCCLCCLPNFEMSRKNFRRLWYGTFQSALIRPITLYFKGILTSDGSIKVPGILYSVILVTSLFIGKWAVMIFQKASSEYLIQYNIVKKFMIFQLVIMIANLQPVIIKLSYWRCSLPFTYLTNQVVLNYQITAIEFFVIGLLCMRLYRKKNEDVQVVLPEEDV